MPKNVPGTHKNNSQDAVPLGDLHTDQHQNFFLAGPGLGTLKKPKYHYIVVGGLLVQELEPLKDLKAEKG